MTLLFVTFHYSWWLYARAAPFGHWHTRTADPSARPLLWADHRARCWLLPYGQDRRRGVRGARSAPARGRPGGPACCVGVVPRAVCLGTLGHGVAGGMRGTRTERRRHDQPPRP